MIALEVYEEFSFRNYLYHYPGTTITTAIQLCPWIGRQVWCDKTLFLSNVKCFNGKSGFKKLGNLPLLELMP